MNDESQTESDEIPLTDRRWRERWATELTRANQLEIALRNLLANAVRHHDLATGTITLGLESDDKIWRLTVTDDGPGIPESERERIFEPFRRLSATPGGAGLGLSLVATAARRLGGAAEILNTRTSRGTTVLLTWPRQVG